MVSNNPAALQALALLRQQMAAFVQRAQNDGLSLDAIQQATLANAPVNAAQLQRGAIFQQALQSTVKQTNDSVLISDLNAVTATRSQVIADRAAPLPATPIADPAAAQAFEQLRQNMAAFAQRAQSDGLNLAAIQQSVLASLPINATVQQKGVAMQQAIQSAVQQTDDPTLTADLSNVTNARSAFKAQTAAHPHRAGGGGKGGAAGATEPSENSIDELIAEGGSASTSDIQAALATLQPTDPNYGTLTAMLAQAQTHSSGTDANSDTL